MLSLREKCLLEYIIDHCNDVLFDIKGMDEESFNNNSTIQRSVAFSIFQIGELSKEFSNDFVKQHTEVPWKRIKGMRDVIGHAYGTITIDRVWCTASIDIVELKNYCESILIKEK